MTCTRCNEDTCTICAECDESSCGFCDCNADYYTTCQKCERLNILIVDDMAADVCEECEAKP